MIRFVLLTALCSACAGTQVVHTTTREERAWQQQDREERLYELAKRHPNAQPRTRPPYPEFHPDQQRVRKPWL